MRKLGGMIRVFAGYWFGRERMDWCCSFISWQKKFPKSEMFGLTSQLKRAVVSIPANIAEGQGAGTKPQFARYCDIAKGSLSEVEYYLVLAKDLEHITSAEYKEAETLRSEVGFMLYRLIASIKK